MAINITVILKKKSKRTLSTENCSQTRSYLLAFDKNDHASIQTLPSVLDPLDCQISTTKKGVSAVCQRFKQLYINSTGRGLRHTQRH